MLREVEELSACPPEDYSRLFKKWKQQEYVNTNDFQFIEPILTQRLIMYDIKKSIGDESNMKATAIKTHLDIAKIADEQGYFQFAAKALGKFPFIDFLFTLNELLSIICIFSSFQLP